MAGGTLATLQSAAMGGVATAAAVSSVVWGGIAALGVGTAAVITAILFPHSHRHIYKHGPDRHSL